METQRLSFVIDIDELGMGISKIWSRFDYVRDNLAIKFMYVPSNGQIIVSNVDGSFAMECYPLQEMDKENLVVLGKVIITKDVYMKKLDRFMTPRKSMVKLVFDSSTITIVPSEKHINQMDLKELVL